MAEQDIISIGYDPAFATQNKEVYDQVLQTYNLLKQMDGLKVGTGGAGYADLKAQAAGLQKQIEQLTAANIKLTQAIADGETKIQQTQQSMDGLVKKLNDAKSALSANADLQKQLTKEVKSGAISADEYRQRMTGLTTTQLKYKAVVTDLNKNLKDQTKETLGLLSPYDALSKRYREAAKAAQDLAAAQGINSPGAKAAALQANSLHKELLSIDETVGKSQRNVGNYGSAFDGASTKLRDFALVLRGSRGPAKLLGEALGVGAQEADQFRLLIEHAAQSLAFFFKGKEAKVAAETEDTAATAANTAAMQAQATTVAGATGTTNTFTVSTEGAAIAETELALATTATSSAMRVLKIALLSLGILTIIAGVALLAYQLYQVATAVSEAEKNQKLYNDTIKEAAKSAASEVAHLVAIKQKLNDLKTPQADRIKYINDYNKVADEGNKIDATQINNLDLINSKIEKQIGLIEKRALAKAAENELAKQAEKVIAAQLEVERYREYADGAKLQELRDKNTANEQENNAVNNKSNSDNLALRNNYMKGVAAQNSDILSGQRKFINAKKTLDKEQAALDRLAGVLSPLFGTGEDGKEKSASAKARDLADKTAEEILKINYEMGKRHIQIQIDANKALIDDDRTYYLDKLLYLKEYNKAKVELIELDRQFEIDSEKLKYDEIQKNLKSQDPATVKGGQAAINDQLEKEKQAHLLRLINIESKYYDEIRRQGQSYLSDISKIYRDQEKIKKEFLDQEREYEEWTLKQIKKAREEQSKGMAKLDKQDADRKKEIQKDIYEFTKEFSNKAIDLVQTLIDAGYTRQQNAIQKLIDANNKYEQAELGRIANTTVSEQEKAAMVIQLNAQTAAKNKQLEDEQKQARIKQAQFDKDIALIKITLNTAVAATNAATTGDPYTAALRAGIVIALGAAEFAIASATPIPTYAEGGTHPGGYAIYGEAGLESVKEPGKAPYLVDSPTMGILPAGTVLTPLKGMINDSMQNSFMNSFENVMVMAQLDSGLKEIKEAIIEQGWHTQQAIRQQKRGGTNIILNGDFGRYLQKTVIN